MDADAGADEGGLTMKHWTINFESLEEQEKIELIIKVCNLETTNSVSKDDLLCMLRYMADNCTH